jgi:hypothetical protein
MINKVISWLDNNMPSYPQGLIDSEIEVLTQSTDKLFKVKLPDSFSSLLKEVNGFSCDGCNIFGFVNDEIRSKFKYLITNNFLYRNKIFQDSSDTHDYLIFGESSLNYIALNIRRGKFILMSNTTLETIKEYDDFDELLETFLGI